MKNKELSSGKKLIRNIFSISIVNYANNFLPLLTMPIIARIIGPEKLGAINMASAFVTYFSLVINYGFDLTGTRAIAKNANNAEVISRIFSEVFTAKLFLFSLSTVAFVVSLYAVPGLGAEKALYIFTYLYCVAHVFTPNWMYQGMQDSHQMAIFQLVSRVLFTATILLVINERSDYVYQPLMLSLSQLLVAVFSFYWSIKRYHIKLHFVRLKKVFIRLSEEKMIFFSMVVGSLNAITNTMVLGMVQTQTAVGYYAVGYKLITILQTFVSFPLLQAMFPYMGESFGKSTEEGILRLRRLAPFITLTTILAGIFIWIAAPLLVTLLYGREFAPGIIVLRILAFIPFLQSLSDLFGMQTMINLKMDKAFFNIRLLGCVVGLVFNVSLSYWGGANGTAFAWVLTEVFVVGALWSFLKNRNISVIDLSYYRVSYFLQMFHSLVNRRNRAVK